MITRQQVAKIIGRNVVLARQAYGTKERPCEQKDLAEIAGCHPNTVVRIEAGESCPYSMTICKLAAALHCKVEDLMPTLDELKPGRRAKLEVVR